MGLFKKKADADAAAESDTNVDAKPGVADGGSSDAADDAAPPVKPVRFYQLFRYADAVDKLYIFLGCVCSIAHGVLLPLFTVFLGAIINSFDQGLDLAELGDAAIRLIILAGVALVLSFFQVYCLMRSAQKQGNRIRVRFIKSVLSQEMAWYDSIDPGELTSRVAGDVDLIQAGIGDKVGSVLQFGSMFVSGFVVGFIFGWKMTLVILSVSPVLAIGGGLMAKVSSEVTTEGQGHYAKAGAVASEVLGMFRIVTAFSGQKFESERYRKNLDAAYKDGVKRANLAGGAMGFTFLVIFCVYGLAFWYGARLVRSEEMQPGDVLTVFFAVIIGAMALGQGAPAFQTFTTARGAAPKVFEIIERTSEINPLSDDGEAPEQGALGDIEFENVDFSYPSRSDVQILDKMSLRVGRGETLALVGASGCGKSTTIQLLERFYDTDAGVLKLDGRNIKEYNVRWLRSQIGFVSQLPTLFAGTIAENIAFGAPIEPGAKGVAGTSRKVVSQADIEAAAKLANAHKFICMLPEKYQTIIGERGAMLSGGQKQRIAIARALIRDPRILLLDEATSALDAASEKLVQNALEKASQGRTTIVIAHRLSTIRGADKIGVVESGKIVELGNHQELMSMADGKYASLVALQNLKASESEGNHEVEDKTLEEIHAEADRIITEDPEVSMSMQETNRKEGVEDETKPDEIELDKKALSRAFKCNADQWPLILIGCIGGGVAGSAFVFMALVFSEVIDLLVSPSVDRQGEINFWSGMFCVLGLVSFVATYLQQGLLGITGEKLTRKLRGQSFDAILRQEIGFFDEKENSAGSLTTRLSMEASQVKGLTGETLGIGANVGITLITGIAVAFSGCWQVALVVLAMMPAVGVGGYIQIKLMTGFDTEGKKKYAQAGTIASEAVDNIRSVASCGIEGRFVDVYSDELMTPLRQGKKSALVAGIAFGVSEFFTFAVFAVSYWFGGRLVEDDACSFVGVNKALNGLLFGAMTLGNVAAFMPDVASAKVAATKIFQLLDRESHIDPLSDEGQKPTISGDIIFENLKFHYPTREGVQVLKKLSVAIGPGKTLALVGESGCGKSTLVSIVERFYDVTGGLVSIDGVRITDMNVECLRSSMSIVLQEPDLFDATIRANITYGLLAKKDSISDEQIQEAARKANAHDFITELPEGYDTVVGPRGGRLSGGQRQRIAIARALIRDPKILLLDEATSALDSKSESIVQEALDRARVGRTVITIAHRLATIQNADSIAVVADGRIAEIGSHEELTAKDGMYSALVRHQMMSGQDEA